MNKEEYILCAAIWYNDKQYHEHQPINVSNGFIICGRRHHNCFMLFQLLNSKLLESLKVNLSLEHNKNMIQGFLTNRDRFINRKEAGKIAFESGQIKKKTDCLFSEDLY